MLLFEIGFLEIRFLDIIDIVLVSILFFQLYKLLKGSIAFNIFIGLVLIFGLYLTVKMFKMNLLSVLLGQFVNVGVIALIIVFQPEIRRFLVLIGKSSKINKNDSFWKTFFYKKWDISEDEEKLIKELSNTIEHLAENKIGALIVFEKNSKLQYYANTGIVIDGAISGTLIESIFHKNNPLHDGAVIISNQKILAAKCILPISEDPNLPTQFGLRHRAAIGITEHSDAIAITISEEKGEIGVAKDGTIRMNLETHELRTTLHEAIIMID